MRVLWFTNTSSCYSTDNNPYNGGGWIASAETEFRKILNLDLAVSFMMDNQPFKVEQNGVIYYPIQNVSETLVNKISKQICLVSQKSSIDFETKSWNYYLDSFKKVIDDFKPDIIHIWGSEAYYGLVCKVTSIPIVLHIQGVLNPYYNAFLPPFVSWQSNGLNKWKMLKVQREWQKSCYRERVIHNGIFHYLGRTDWDLRVAHILNPNSQYYHVDEILRESFYTDKERVIPEKLTIITTISKPLYKGFDFVLKTAKILKENLNIEFQWNCYGNIEPDFIESIVGIKHKDVNVALKGIASSKELTDAELNATLYFHSSYIDNSPNSLCEAQMLAIPVISTNVGGISSLVEQGKTGFLIPANDPYQGAYLIERLFKDRELNNFIGLNGKAVALRRHNKETIISQILNVYSSVINK